MLRALKTEIRRHESVTGTRDIRARREWNQLVAGGKVVESKRYMKKYGQKKDDTMYICTAIVAFVGEDEPNKWREASDIETQLWARAKRMSSIGQKRGEKGPFETPVVEEDGSKKKVKVDGFDMSLLTQSENGTVVSRAIQGICLYSHRGAKTMGF